MIDVTRLNGEKYYLNPHQIECIELNPDTTLVMLSGKKLVVKEDYQDVFDKIVK
ncbi:MAG: flagellar FlbD family protein, partial [Spirochaetaceae bacterium]|nr:flagellar FlbD family protein [Spirochaetaceae bacterium]